MRLTIKPHLKKPLQIIACLPLLMFISSCNDTAHTLEKTLQVSDTRALPRSKHLKYNDYHPVPIKGRQPASFAVHGIDLSRHNKAINWPLVKKAGIDFVFVKATEGRDNRDVRYQEFWRAAARVGIKRSAYHFYYFCASPESQARNYIKAVPKSDHGLPPVLDAEWNPGSPTCTKRPPARTVVNHLKRWLTIIEKHYGQKPIIYTSIDFHRDNFANGALPGYQYWLRSVKTEPKYVYGKRPWVFWQYTSSGKVPGIEDRVDINTFNGTRKQWNTWLRKNRR